MPLSILSLLSVRRVEVTFRPHSQTTQLFPTLPSEVGLRVLRNSTTFAFADLREI